MPDTITDERLSELEAVCNSPSTNRLNEVRWEGIISPKEVAAIITRLRDADAKVKALEAVVSALPLTADGVRIVPGMRVWKNHYADRPPLECVVSRITFIMGSFMIAGRGFEVLAMSAYSTHEAAALAAKESS